MSQFELCSAAFRSFMRTKDASEIVLKMRFFSTVVHITSQRAIIYRKCALNSVKYKGRQYTMQNVWCGNSCVSFTDRQEYHMYTCV